MLVRLEACGVCHTDMYTASGADPSGYAPTVLGHEGAGIVEKAGPGVSLVREGDRVVTLFSPQCGECEHCISPRTNLCTAIRGRAGARAPARRHHAAEPGRRGHPPLHGHLHVRRVHGDAGDRSGRGQPRRAGRPRVRIRLRAVDRAGRGHQHGGRGARIDRGGLRRRPGRPGRRGRGAVAGRRADRVRGPVRGAAGDGARPGRHRDVRGRRRQRREDAGDDRRHGRRLHVRGHR